LDAAVQHADESKMTGESKGVVYVIPGEDMGDLTWGRGDIQGRLRHATTLEPIISIDDDLYPPHEELLEAEARLGEYMVYLSQFSFLKLVHLDIYYLICNVILIRLVASICDI